MKNCYIFFLFIFLQACQQELPLTLPHDAPFIVVNCLFQQDSVWALHISSSLSINNPNAEPQNITDAEVKIIDNQQIETRLIHVGNGIYKSNTYPIIGKAYTLKVTSPSFEGEITATDSIPHQGIQLLDVIADTSQNISPFGTSEAVYYPIHISMKDNHDLTSFYRLNIRYLDSAIWTGFATNCPYYFHKADTNMLYDGLLGCELATTDRSTDIIRSPQMCILMNDGGWQGQSKQLEAYFINQYSFTLWGTINDGDYCITSNYHQVFLEIQSLSPAAYKYVYSVLQQRYSVSDPFASYVEVYSNIQGGRGIFAGYHRSMIRLF